jgi:2-polyprenyl-3-methyl-5-hydroxy-6-metoxy-1,4-benzoquinol methylase
MLAQRAIAEELMDADDLDAATYAAVVHDLAKVNTLTLARRPTLAFLAAIQRNAAMAWRAQAERTPGVEHQFLRPPKTAIKILDVGFGDGDMLRTIEKWGRSRHVDLTLVGIDLNPRSAPAARAGTPNDVAIDYRTGDYESCAGEGWDVILSSLVAHHMTHDQLIAFLRFMDDHARVGWFVNDLHRHGFAYRGFPLLATLMRWHPIVRHDGQLSIARSYRPGEWPPLLQEAGVDDAIIARRFPFRLCVAKHR